MFQNRPDQGRCFLDSYFRHPCITIWQHQARISGIGLTASVLGGVKWAGRHGPKLKGANAENEGSETGGIKEKRRSQKAERLRDAFVNMPVVMGLKLHRSDPGLREERLRGPHVCLAYLPRPSCGCTVLLSCASWALTGLCSPSGSPAPQRATGTGKPCPTPAGVSLVSRLPKWLFARSVSELSLSADVVVFNERE